MKSPSPTARPAKNKKIDINFSGGKLTSDAGVLLCTDGDFNVGGSDNASL